MYWSKPGGNISQTIKKCSTVDEENWQQVHTSSETGLEKQVFQIPIWLISNHSLN